MSDPHPNPGLDRNLEYSLDYSAAGVPVRKDLREIHAGLLEYLRGPGCWLDGAERIAVAQETRNALQCVRCRDAKQALSPEHAQGEHAKATELSATLVDVIHRIRTDSGRLSKAWFDKTLATGLDVTVYVETVGIVALIAGADAFCKAIGIEPFPLPKPHGGDPIRHSPNGTRDGIAWVPMLAPEDASGPEADLYPDVSIPNIVRALSLVPDHPRFLQRWSKAHYVDLPHLSNPTVGRDLDRVQIELVAARVSALNECFY